MKQHKLTTLKEVLDVATEENVEVLVNDLGEWIKFQLGLRSINEVVGKELARDNNYGVLLWNDDGKKGLKNIKVEVVDKL